LGILTIAFNFLHTDRRTDQLTNRPTDRQILSCKELVSQLKKYPTLIGYDNSTVETRFLAAGNSCGTGLHCEVGGGVRVEDAVDKLYVMTQVSRTAPELTRYKPAVRHYSHLAVGASSFKLCQFDQREVFLFSQVQ
jgi:hypothetical protein